MFLMERCFGEFSQEGKWGSDFLENQTSTRRRGTDCSSKRSSYAGHGAGGGREAAVGGGVVPEDYVCQAQTRGS